MQCPIKLECDIECDTCLTADNTYVLCGIVRVLHGATLQIEPGTKILAEKKSSLVIAGGARLVAKGTREAPIVFTSASKCPEPGDWAGIQIQGYKATAEPLDPFQIRDSTCHRNSGIIKYLHIAYAGSKQSGRGRATGGALVLFGVSKKTCVKYIQVTHSLTDSFQFLGGNVNASHLVSYKARGAGFRFALGYPGIVQFILDIHKGCHNNTAGIVVQQEVGIQSQLPLPILPDPLLLITNATITNATIIGPLESSDRYPENNIGVYFQSGSLGEIHNSIVTGWNHALVIGPVLGDVFALQDTLSQSNIFAGINSLDFIGTIDPDLIAARYELLTQFNAFLPRRSAFAFYKEHWPVPERRSTLTQQVLYLSTNLADPFVVPVDYRGAFEPGNEDCWLQEWSSVSC